MKKILLLIILTAAVFPNLLPANSIKITVTSQMYNQDYPWQKMDVKKHTVSGTVIQGNMVLMSSYSLKDHVNVEVSRYEGAKKYQAEILIKDYNNGLAVLKVENKEFFNGLKPVKLADNTGVRGKKGIIRTWDDLGAAREYNAETIKSSIRIYKPNCAVLMHTMSTNMSSGGNGEPVFINDNLAGIVTGLDAKQGIVYVISADTIRRMIRDFNDGKYDGVPFFWIDYTAIKNDSNLRHYLGMGKNDSGIYVTDIAHSSSGSYVLKKGDVILSIDGINVDDNGMYKSLRYGRLNFYGIIQTNKFVGDRISMSVLRKKKKIKVHFKLKPVIEKKFIIPQISYDKQPNYYIYGGLLFQELTYGLMTTWGGEWEKKADMRLLYYYYTNSMKSDNGRKRYLILNRILPAACNSGYQYKQNLILKSVNSTEVRDIRHLKKLVDDFDGEFLRFDFIGSETIILKKDEVKKCRNSILKKYTIYSDYFFRE
jgi:S1-C subfamily serine protease